MLNFAVIGLGWWGKIIVNILASSATLRVTSAVDPDAESSRLFCQEKKLKHYTDLDEALADPTIDAVILTTPNRMHEAQIIEAAKAGKHVFCEKPLALTLSSAERSMSACRANNVRLGVGHERRFEPPIQFIRSMLEGGKIGRLLQIEGNFSQNKFLSLPKHNWRLSKEEAGCGPITATGIHLLDLACSFAGPPLQVRAFNSNLSTGFESGDSASVHLVFGEGVSASINAILTTPFFSRFAVFGSRGWIEVHDKSHVESPSGWLLRCCVGANPVEVHNFDTAAPVLKNLEAFAAAIAGEQSDYPIGLQEMLTTTSALEAVFKAVESNQIVTPTFSALLHSELESRDMRFI